MIRDMLTIEQRMELLQIRHKESKMPIKWIGCRRTVDDEVGYPLLWSRLFDEKGKLIEKQPTDMVMRLASAGPELIKLVLDLANEVGRFSEFELELIYARLSYLIPPSGEPWVNRV